MATTLKKGQLPTKICATCGLPFEYRKKWRNNWEAVKYCSERCQRNKASLPNPGSHAERSEA